MRSLTSALCATAAVSLLAGCAGGLSSSAALPGTAAATRPFSVADGLMPPRGLVVLHSILHPDIPLVKKKNPGGIYVSQFYGTEVLGYPAADKSNKGPTCSVSGVDYVNGIAVDGKGNLMVPDASSEYLRLYKGPGMCGKAVKAIADTYGQLSDVASNDSLTGKIALANIFDSASKSPGSIAVCTLKGGCTANLTNSAIYEAGGVAMDNAGDCFVSASGEVSGGGEAAIVYFKGCSGSGVAAKGVKNTSYGGLDIDKDGNLVSVDSNAGTVYIYSGCNPTCKLVGGPFTLHGDSYFGKVNRAGTQYAMADIANGAVDVYSYSTKAIKYEYSFNKDLTESAIPIGIAYNPRSKQ